MVGESPGRGAGETACIMPVFVLIIITLALILPLVGTPSRARLPPTAKPADPTTSHELKEDFLSFLRSEVPMPIAAGGEMVLIMSLVAEPTLTLALPSPHQSKPY
jgi:hypothetical protein